MSPHAKDFTPPHCPRPTCPKHRDPTDWRFQKAGFYERQAAPRRIQRYRCLDCGVNFSRQSYDVTYYLKRPDLLAEVFEASVGCSGLRQIARRLGVAHSTVGGQLSRLGRHCLLFQHLHRPDELPDEPLVLDGFESYEYSQYHPLHFHVAVGGRSHFFHAFTDSELRRKGRMTPEQLLRRAELEERHGRPDPRSIEKEMRELVRLVAPEPVPLKLLTDEHPAYLRAFRWLEREGWTIQHETTPSRRARTTGNPLFPVNLLDLLIRHCGANHKRETIAFSKRRQRAAERLAILQVWRNFMKSFSENARDASPAQRLGLTDRLLTTRDVLEQRLFPTRVQLPDRLRLYYEGRVETRRLAVNRRHELKRAA